MLRSLLLATCHALLVVASVSAARKPIQLTLTAAEEARLGDALAAAIDTVTPATPDGDVRIRLDTLARDLLATPAPWPWRLHVLADARITSFDVPGGHLYVSRGLLAACERDDEVRSLLAHQMGHALQRDTTRLLVAGYGEDLVRRMARGEADDILQGVAANLAASGTLARHGEAAELLADGAGSEVAARAGIERVTLVSFLERLSKRADAPAWAGGLPWKRVAGPYVAVHPVTRRRLEALRSSGSP